ncbi:MAG TPA: BTAD domain-containing putative transcriptional regulator [Pseudonocardiaceae bacterium]
MRFGILGPLEVRAETGELIPVGGPRPRSLLAAFLLEPGRLISTDRLIDAVYGDQPPQGAANALQAQISRLRRVLPVIEHHPAGYRLAIEPAQVDAHRFAALVSQGLPEAALALWRGPALADVPGFEVERARLTEQRAAAREDLAEARLALGQYDAAIAELRELVSAEPLRERSHGQLMRALHALGRSAEALAVFADLRARLADELGADPSTEIADLHLAVLRADAAPVPIRPPAQPTGFVGREADLVAVGDRLRASRLVTLVRPGGVGKTRLAIEAAGEACFVELAQSSGSVAQAILAALRLREAPLLLGQPNPAPALDRLVAALADRELLIVLDNCEHVIDDVARCAHALLAACPDLRILATSREGLGITGEALFPVGPLPPASAARLFVDRARSVDPGFTADDAEVRRICVVLDGLPLAIELAAARLRTLSFADIVAGLDDRFTLLARGNRVAAPRHQTLRAVVEWSWDLLDEPARQLASRLAVFAGGATREAIDAVCGVPHVDDVLADLVDQSLVDASGRYRMLATIRLFCLEKLGPADDVRRGHAEYFLALAETADPHLRRAEQLDWLARLTAEHDNLQAALHWAAGADRALALRLIGALSGYWFLRGVRGDVATVAAGLLARFDAPVPGLEQEYVLTVTHATAAGEVDAQHLTRADALMNTLDEPIRQPFLVVYWALVTGPPIRFDIERMAPIMRRFVASDDPWCPALTDLSLNFLHWFGGGDVERAEAACVRARDAFRALGERWGLAQAVEALAVFADVRGELVRAIELTDEALDLVGQLGAGEELADMRCRRAERLLRAGRIAEAEADFRTAADLARAGRLVVPLALARRGLGELARGRGDLVSARNWQELALRECGTDWLGASARARILTALGRIAEAEGEPAEAIRHHHAAIAVARDNRNAAGLADTIAGLAGAVAATEPVRAAQLLGIAQTLLGAPLRGDQDAARTASALVTVLGSARYAELSSGSPAA